MAKINHNKQTELEILYHIKTPIRVVPGNSKIHLQVTQMQRKPKKNKIDAEVHNSLDHYISSNQ